jgi:phospho-N-acetylmuramoyl-pentapeptide-transferase
MRLVLIAGAVSLISSLILTPMLIRLLQRRGLAQAIRQSTEDVHFPAHDAKHGTPSMGGVAILLALTLGYVAAHIAGSRPPSYSGLLAFFLTMSLGAVGLADDYLKIFKQRSTGIRASTKLIGQATAALTFAYLALQNPTGAVSSPASQAISFVRDTEIILPTAIFFLWIWLMVTATSNGVNLTDGLDGLATGAAVMTFGAYTIMSVWQYGQSCVFNLSPRCYEVADPFDLAVFAAAFAGACFGFLWYNTSPANIFMGDTGSLSIGGGIVALAVMTRTELLLPLLAGLFLVITLSVILQVGSFKLRGKRIFRMAPLHHHFELLGWQEVTIVVRFWIIQGLAVAVGVAVFYAEWVRQ